MNFVEDGFGLANLDLDLELANLDIGNLHALIFPHIFLHMHIDLGLKSSLKKKRGRSIYKLVMTSAVLIAIMLFSNVI